MDFGVSNIFFLFFFIDAGNHIIMIIVQNFCNAFVMYCCGVREIVFTRSRYSHSSICYRMGAQRTSLLQVFQHKTFMGERGSAV